MTGIPAPSTSPDAQRPDRRRWLGLALGFSLASALMAIVIVTGLPDDALRTTVNDVFFVIVEVGVTGACALAAWQAGRRSRRLGLAWAVLAVGQGLWLLGDFIWFILEVVLRTQPYPSVADVFYLAYYPFFLAGIVLLPGALHSRFDRAKLALDAGAVWVAVTVIYWVAWLGPQWTSLERTDPLTLFISIGYPVGDLVLIWATFTLLMRPLSDLPRMPMLLLGLSAIVGAGVDLLYAYQVATDTYVNGGLLDVGWLAVLLLCLWAAAFQGIAEPRPTSTEPAAPSQAERSGLWAVRLALPYLGLFITLVMEVLWVPGVLLGQTPGGVLYLGAALLFLLVSIRQMLVLIDNTRLSKRLTAELVQRTAVEADLRSEIAARQRAQQAAEESERFAAQLASAMPSHVIVAEWVTQRIVYANRVTTTIRECQAGRVPLIDGTRLLGREVHPADQDALALALERIPHLADAEDLALEVRVRARANTWRDLGIRCRVFTRDAEHQPAQLLVVWDDISAARQSERALAENQRLLSRIAAAVPSTLTVWAVGAESAGDQVIFQNRSMVEALGFSSSPACTGPESVVPIQVHPDDRTGALGVRRAWPDLGDGAVLQHEFRVQDAAGRWHWMEARFLVFARDTGGAVTQMIGVTEDVTARRELQNAVQAERDFAQLVLTTLGQGVAVLDPAGRCEYINPAGAEMLGLSNPSDLIGAAFLDNPAWTVPAEVRAEIQDLSSQAHPVRFETRFTRADGHGVDLWAVMSGRFQDDTFRGTVAVFTDVTVQKAMQQELADALNEAQESARAAQAATRAKSEFLANMSHEIRTPMSAIIGIAELLQDERLPDDQRRQIQIMIDSGRALLGIINDILDFSKIEAGRLQLDVQAFDLNTVVEGTVDLLAQQARAKGLRLHVFVDPALPLTLQGDASRLRQIVLNLLSNAVKFTPSGHVRVSADLGAITTGIATVILRVSDTGIGISAEAQTRLFQPFEQAESGTTRRYGGTGLGLAIVKRLVDLMGGQIHLDSGPERGTTLTITLPFAVSPSDVHRSTPSVGRDRVLLLEPDPVAAQIAERYLAASGWTCVRVSEVAVESPDLRPEAGLKAVVVGRWADLTETNPNLESLLTDPGLDRLARVVVTDGVPADPDRHPWVARPLKREAFLAALHQAFGQKDTDLTSTPLPPPATALVPVTRLQKKRRVLLAEDNPTNQMVAHLQLNKLGCEVVIVADGAAAVAAYIDAPDGYQLVLMDCQMPVLDGFEATRAIRAWEAQQTEPPHITIVAMTANAMAGDRELCLEAGMDDYLSKPVSRQALEHLLNGATAVT